MLNRLVILTLIMAFCASHAEVVGTYGDTWAIKEKSLLSLLKKRASKVDIVALKKRWSKKVNERADRPEGVLLPRAVKSTHHDYYPVAEAKNNVLDAKGNVIVASGTKINALTIIPYYKPYLVFIDGSDAAQIKWVNIRLKNHPEAKIILTNGSVKKTVKLLNRSIFFDQKARMIKRFKIEALPALVTRKGVSLDVHEVAINGEGYECAK